MDLERSALEKINIELTAALNELLPEVLHKTGFKNVFSLHGKIGGKFANYIDIQNEVISSSDHFSSLWLEGFAENLKKHGKYLIDSSEYATFKLLQEHKVFQQYLLLFLKRTYIRNYGPLSKKKPKIEDSEIWIGQENANYGILITPRFREGKWENDKSEIRHFPANYWSIGHVLRTGLLIPYRNERMKFKTPEDYLKFFRNVIVRNSGSPYEEEIAKYYSEYVLSFKISRF